MGQTIRFTDADGATDAYLASAQVAPGPPVLLLHTWWGLNQTMRDLADRLAGDGFTVLAPDLFDGTVNATIEEADAFTSSIEQGDGRPDGLNPDRITLRVKTALDHLLTLPEVRGDRAGIVALSFGGWYGNSVAAERADVGALVSIYSDVYEAPDGAAYLGHFAEDDQFVDSAPVAEMAATLPAGSGVHLYPGMKHWFMEPDRPEYNREAAELAHARTVDFLHANLT